jgi:hypothetical protein
MGHAYKTKKLRGNGKQMLSDKITNILQSVVVSMDRLCGLVVRVSGYRYRGLGFDPRRYQIF